MTQVESLSARGWKTMDVEYVGKMLPRLRVLRLSVNCDMQVHSTEPPLDMLVCSGGVVFFSPFFPRSWCLSTHSSLRFQTIYEDLGSSLPQLGSFTLCGEAAHPKFNFSEWTSLPALKNLRIVSPVLKPSLFWYLVHTFIYFFSPFLSACVSLYCFRLHNGRAFFSCRSFVW